ncbi:MAG: amino acid adenylation domain-containing protein [Roseibium album]|uniref:amino acid adenylation domain-containing protein n=1 Tax=Roseibium album TaxID=311410 RepID=UPI0032EE0A67
MSPGPSDTRTRMAQLLDKELVERAHARLAAQDATRLAHAVAIPREVAAASDLLSADVCKIAAAALRIPENKLDPQENLANFGVDSIAITEIMAQISKHFAISVAPTTFFEAKNLDDLGAILMDRYGVPIEKHYAASIMENTPIANSANRQHERGSEPGGQADTADTHEGETGAESRWMRRYRAVFKPAKPHEAKPWGTATTHAEQSIPHVKPSEQEAGAVPIAILSMEGMFPQSPDLQAFESHLAAGDDCMEEVPAERWDWRSVFGDPKKGAFTDVKFGGFIPQADHFDAGFFSISPREAELMDPQHRLFMECVWSLIERGGYAPGSLAGRKIGLFLGINLLDYTNMVNRAGIMDAQQLTGLGHAFCPNRLSFLLDIHGPSEVVDTACSSSLVAVHRAVSCIRFEGCEMAIAGGSNLLLSPMQHIMFSKVGMITQDGRCKAFSRDADGYARSDGVGAVLLKRLDLAERDGDPILGVIRGSAEHHGGSATSLTAPNPKAQARLIVEAHKQAGVDPRTIGLIECHGTGTPLGDPVETEGLKLAFKELYENWGLDPPAQAFIGLGSVKSNIGHTETAAGVAGLIKVLLAMKGGTLFKTIHAGTPNPLLDLDGSPFYLLQEASDWKRLDLDGKTQPLRAGVSSFGAGGANVHLVVEEYRRPAGNAWHEVETPLVVPLSAKTEAALEAGIARLCAVARQADLRELAYTLQAGRDAMRCRAVFLATSSEDLARKLEVYLGGDATAAITGRVPGGRRGKADPLNPSERNAEIIARHWAEGGDVQWARLYGKERPRRVSLPAYAFQRKRYWLPLEEANPRHAGGPLSPQPGEAGQFALVLTGQEVFLADHKVAGTPVLPGVAYLELVRSAAVQNGLKNPLLRQIVWLAPLRVEGHAELFCNFAAAENGGFRVEVSSLADTGERQLHAQLHVSEAGSCVERSINLEALRQSSGQYLTHDEVYAAFDGIGLAYGAGHRVINRLTINDRTQTDSSVFAEIELPQHMNVSLGDFVFHPSLVDGALQSAIGVGWNDEGPETALPFSLDSAETFGPCETKMWVSVRTIGGREAARPKMDVDLVAGDGSVRVALKGFATRALKVPKKNECLRFEPRQRPLPTTTGVEERRRRVVLIVGSSKISGMLADISPEWDVRLLDDDPAARPDERYRMLARQILEIAKGELSSGEVLIQLILEAAEDQTALAGLASMFRSIRREHRSIGGQVLLVSEMPSPENLQAVLTRNAVAPAGAVLRLQSGALTEEIWEEVPASPTPEDVPWRTGGVYFITGGTGALGQGLAREIFTHVTDCTVVLASRSDPDAALADWIRKTSGLHHLTVDMSDQDAVMRSVADLRRKYGQLNGVIHMAGVIADGVFSQKTPEQLDSVLAPKVSGAIALDRALGTEPLDFFALYSSISGVVGNPGQVDYCAANGFIDGFAHERESRRLRGECQGRTVSIAWPLWRDGGMTLSKVQEDLMRRTTGLAPLETQNGVKALYEALAGTASRVMFATGKADRIRRFVEEVFKPETEIQQPPILPVDTELSKKSADPAILHRRLLESLTEIASEQLKVQPEDLDPDEELTEYGFDSIGFTQFANRLNEHFDLELTPTLFFEFPTLAGLAAHLCDEKRSRIAVALGMGMSGSEDDARISGFEIPGDPTEPAKYLAPSVPAAAVINERPDRQDDAVAIIGMSGQFPGATDVEAFWQLLKEGRDAISEVPQDRWDWRDYWGDPLTESGKGNVKWGGFLEGIGEFDAAFFGVTPPETRMMDPQHRLLLTQAWRVMEDAGYAPSSLAGSDTGVFVGTADTGYSRLVAEAGIQVEGYSMTGLAPSLGPNRISYFYDFHGPSIAVETACSSALIAVHRGVEAIRTGHCLHAIAGGVNTLLLPEAFVGFAKAGMLSPEGRCKPFSSRADGYARGEGIGLVMLKSLAAAERDGDRILAVVRASAENHGGHAASLTAPNPKAQADLIRTAYRRSGIDPRTVGYVEAHGTGTPLGDPIEIEALTAAFSDLSREAEADYGAAPSQHCAIGSVKSNIGHLELAAGIAGLIKVLLQLRHGEIVKSLNCGDPNPYLKLDGGPFHLADRAEIWKPGFTDKGENLPRRAGVSSFGFGGTNAHVVLEEYQPAISPPSDYRVDEPELIILSARTEAQLKETAERFIQFLSSGKNIPELSDIAITLQQAREAMDFRLGFLAGNHSVLLERLQAFVDGRNTGKLHAGNLKSGRKRTSVLENDGPLREAAAGLATRGRADDLLALWVDGFGVDWATVRRGRPGARVALPGYPFSRTRYWIGETPGRQKASLPHTAFTHAMDGSESYLRDHQVHGSKILPGVFSLELLSRCLASSPRDATAFELTGHTWVGSVPVTTGEVELEVSLPDGPVENARYVISAKSADGVQRHAEGVLRKLLSVSSPALDLPAARSIAAEPVDVAELYRQFEDLGLNYGPAHRGLNRIWRGEDTAVARLELPRESDTGFALHPSMLDGALQTVLALQADASGSNELALPYSVRSTKVYGPTHPEMWAVVRKRDASFDISLCDDLGNIKVIFEGFVTRSPASAGTREGADTAFGEPAQEAGRQKQTLEIVTNIAARTLEVEPSSLDVDTELGDFGFDSVSMTGFATQINADLGLELTPADFFEFATLARLADHICDGLTDEQLGMSRPGQQEGAVASVPGKAKKSGDDASKAAQVSSLQAGDDPIVVVGQSCCFPMAEDGDAFWSNLVAGRDCISRIPADRWSWQAVDGNPREEPGKTNIHWGGFIDGVYEFDPLFFGISPREAKLMDPQQRLMMTHAWKAIEDAGHSPRGLAGKKVGVFVGTSSSGYRGQIGSDAGGEGYVATGSVPSVGPNRISYFLDLHGPSEPVETACSSSLVALHRAVQAIKAGDCDMALVGGVNTILTPEAHINFARAGMLSENGRCKTFSADADGYVRGEGVGMLFVRRLSDAERDRDPILAIIRGTAINHGGHANSLTAPNTSAQADLLTAAYENAGVDPRTVGYVEAHGTGTALGDPVEVNALKSAFRSPSGQTEMRNTGLCGLGSVKTNIGHLELAAGVAGVIKVLKQMEHRTLAPSLNCKEINPYIDLDGTPFRVVRAREEWTPLPAESGIEQPLRAGVSSFGFGGVNAHAILEEYRPAENRHPLHPENVPSQIIVLSARDKTRLNESAQALLRHLDTGQVPDDCLADLAYTLQVGRADMAVRLAIVCRHLDDLRTDLLRYLRGEAAETVFAGPDNWSPPQGVLLRPGAHPDEIARHWIDGGEINWKIVNPGSHRRLRLPTYSFARDIFRIETDSADGDGQTGNADASAANIVEADAFYLKDHVVRGNRILPGAMSLEIACQAALAAPGIAQIPFALTDVTWRRPVELNAGQKALKVLFGDQETASVPFKLVPETGEPVPYVTGKVSALPAAIQPSSVDLNSLHEICRTAHDPDWLYACYSALGIDYGPSLRAITELSTGGNGVLVRLRVPRVIADQEGDFLLHPSILDAAFQAVLVAFASDGDAGLALPFAIDRLTVYGPTVPDMWAHLSVSPAASSIRKLNIDLIGETGKICVRLEGFSLKELKAPVTERPSAVAQATGSGAPAGIAAGQYFAELIARETEVEISLISLSAPLEDYGIDSVLIVRLTDLLERDFGKLPRTLFFEHQSLEELIGYFQEHHGQRLAEMFGGEGNQRDFVASTPALQNVAPTGERSNDAIAIIGLSGRYPGARTPQEFWQNLAAGRDCITEIPENRWDHSDHYDPERKPGKTTSRWGGFIEGHDRFDPMFFNIAPREAQFMDPQERLFLQCAWETLEDAGYTRASLTGHANGHANGLAGVDAGVFVGVMWEEYQLYGRDLAAAGHPVALSGNPASIANRVSYFLNFNGPSLALDTMCSSSLTAIHLACESLRSGGCSVALAGGVNLTTHPNKYLALAQGRFLSSEGRCESFGEGGDGYVPAEGVGAVLLKPLGRAETDGDRIYGVILGSALNHGGKTNGYTVPNLSAQSAVIQKALSNAGITAQEVSFVEAHGTGTSLGDPIEIEALTRVFGGVSDRSRRCAIGSVKSNIGHAESAAGIAGLTKVLLQFEHKQIVPSLHSDRLNPHIDFDASPFQVQQKLAAWETDWNEGTAQARIASLSSFGAGGSNAHFVVAEYEKETQPVSPIGPAVYPFSARDAERLSVLLSRFRNHLKQLEDKDMPSVAYTLQEGRETFEQRLAIVADDRADLVNKLDCYLADAPAIEGIFHNGAKRQTREGVPPNRYSETADRWVRFVDVDWAALRVGRDPLPISLPTYPFAEDYCWLPDTAPQTLTPSGPSKHREMLPLLFEPVWAETPRPAGRNASVQNRYCVLCGVRTSHPLLADELERRGVTVLSLVTEDTEPHAVFESCALQLFTFLKTLSGGPLKATLQVVVPTDRHGSLLEGLSGLLRSAALENKKWSCQLVGTDTSAGNFADCLEADAHTAGTQCEIRYLSGLRFVRSWNEIQPERTDETRPWKDRGVYLLTGGAGGVGLHIARAIADGTKDPILWLTGRSAPDQVIEQQVRDLEMTGATVRYRPVDITDKAAVSALLDEIRKSDGDLTGVFHGAGVTKDGLLSRKTETTFKSVLAPKVAGATVLDEAIGSMPIEFFVLLASATGALGNPGQTDYGTANAFLDRFAAWRNVQAEAGLRRGRSVSIDWPYWRDGGMQMDANTIRLMDRSAGVRPLETGAAIAALDVIVASVELEQVLVLEGDHARLREMMRPGDGSSSEKPESTISKATMTGTSANEAGASRRMAIVAAIKTAFSKCLGIPEDRLDEESTIDRFGVDSVSALEIVEAMERDFGPLSQTILFEFQTIGRLADELLGRGGTAFDGTSDSAELLAPPLRESASERDGSPKDREIAIIAVAGRFPGAETIEGFADLLREGRDCVTEIPEDRAHLLKRYSSSKGEPGTSYCKWGAFLEGVDCFDADFFGYSPRAADLADPQERLFLETAWHLFERAGHTRPYLAEHYDKRVGVFVGAMYNQYPGLAVEEDAKALLALNSYSAIANRVSFFFDLQGPSIALDSMCSSGLQAVHQACQSLNAGECQLALAGGVNLTIHPLKFEALSRAGLVSSDPQKRSLGAGDGYLPAEGVGAVLLKPLDRALADQDQVLGVIKGGFANHSGHSAGYAVPNADAQVKLLQGAYESAGIDPDTIDYIEVAATGSNMGDRIELRALSKVFAGRPGHENAVALGSVKTNMGHAEAASGLAQLTKVLLQFQHRELFPSFVKGGVEGVFDGLPFKPQLKGQVWETTRETPLRAAISSFGAGGSNVHVILEEAPATVQHHPVPEPRIRRPFPVFARTRGQLEEVRKELAGYLRSANSLSLEALSRTLSIGREALDAGITYSASNIEELIEKLESPLPSQLHGEPASDDAVAVSRSGPMLVLPGYPFARERHWLKSEVQEPDTGTINASPPSRTAQKTTAGKRPRALQVICSTLARELGVAAADIESDASFAALGVDSMARLRLGYALEKELGVVLQNDDLDWEQTPSQLAAIVETFPPGEANTPSIDHLPGRAGPYYVPLGEAQKGLWVYQSLYPGSSDYNVPMAFKCTSADRQALQQAVDWLVLRYPILATRVVLDGETAALTAMSGSIEVQPITLSKEIETEACLKQRAAIPFDLDKGVFRVEHAAGGKLDRQDSIFLITAHHIITDGLTSEILARDFWSAYAHFAYGESAPEAKSDLSADYADFAEWEAGFIRSQKGQEQKSYWLDMLKGPLPRLQWPIADKVRHQETGASESLVVRLSDDLAGRLDQRARERRVSASSVYLSAFASILYKYTGQQDLVIGIPALRRPMRRFAETVGYCANIVALRLAIDPGQTDAEFADFVDRELAAGLAKSEYPFAEVARETGGTETGEPPYEVTFAYQGFGDHLREHSVFARGEVELMPEIRQTGGSVFGIEIQKTGGNVRLVANFDSNLFRSDTVALMLQHYQEMLEFMAGGSGLSLSKMSVLTAAEEDRALHHWNRSGRAAVAETPIHELILNQAKRTPGAVAISGNGTNLSYKKLIARSHEIARSLESFSLKHGDRIAVLLGRESDGIATLMAAMSVGAVWVPIDPDLPKERVAFILKDAGALAVVSKGDWVKKLRDLPNPPRHVLDLDNRRSSLKSRFTRLSVRNVKPDDPAYIIYTSGSTGRPKGVIVSHKALSAHCQIIGEEYGLSPRDVVLQFASTSVDTALEQILPILTVGGRLELHPKDLQSPGAFLTFLKKARVTVADLPPVYLSELLRSWTMNDEDLTALPLRLLVVGGEAFTSDLLSRWKACDLPDRRLINAYGPTEATITALVYNVKADGFEGSVPIGRPLPGTEIYILDQDGNPVPDGIIGELHIGGDRLADGYHNQPDLTAEKFGMYSLNKRTIRLYSTGDLASFRPHSGGLVEFHGRVDDQVKVRGHRIELGEVEAAISANGIAEVAVVLESNSAGDRVLTAYVGSVDDRVQSAELKKNVTEMLPAYMVPVEWVIVEGLPKTVSGKIDRKSLTELKKTRRRNIGEPGGRTHGWHESRLVEIWNEVLDKDLATSQLGADDDFGEAGGNSLLTIRLLSRIQEVFGTELSVSDLARAKTISGQARLLQDKNEEGAIENPGPIVVPSGQGTLLVKLKNAAPSDNAKQEKPLFLLHAAAGTLGFYQPLVDAWTMDTPLYGLRANGLRPGEDCKPQSVEALASGCCEEIRKVQPDGPYRLCGWSFGGIVAFETARQLSENGQEVSFLGLVDSYAPDDLRAFEQTEGLEEAGFEKACERAFLRDLFAADVEIEPDQDVVEQALGFPQFELMFPGGTAEDLHRLFAVYSANYKAALEYVPERTDVSIHLVRATEGADGDYLDGWSALTSAKVQLHRVDANHFSVIHRPELKEWLSGRLGTQQKP